MRIPLVDLSRQHAEIAEAVKAGWARVLSESLFILGPEVAAFEKAFAAFCGVSHCIGAGNGTDAIELALRSLHIGNGDEVIVPANTFIATALAPTRAGANVRLVDCLPGSYLMDPEKVEAVVTRRTRALIPVHLFGQMAAVEDLTRFGIDVIEDAAQAQGAERHGKRAGSLGAAAATSFYPTKNLGAYGDGGAVMTDRDDLALEMRALHNWGSDRKYHHPVAGFNSRLDTLQAVVLLANLDRLEKSNEERRQAAFLYDELLGEEDRIQRSITLMGNYHIYHLYVVEVPDRDRVLGALHAAGIAAGIHYPVPIHLQGALRDLGYREGDFPVTESAAKRMISLPLFPGITAAEQEFVAAHLRDAL